MLRGTILNFLDGTFWQSHTIREYKVNNASTIVVYVCRDFFVIGQTINSHIF